MVVPDSGGETMDYIFPSAVPEVPVSDMDSALEYYQHKLGFNVDWGQDGGGIAGISQGDCRIFLTDAKFRERFSNERPAVVWLNLNNKEEVNDLHEKWHGNGAKILHPPESNSWSRLHEFVAADLDGNLFRVFYNF
jgi:predicted lactoylglutathione lyase